MCGSTVMYGNGQNMRVVLTAWIFNKLDILEASFFLYRSVKLLITMIVVIKEWRSSSMYMLIWDITIS